jgi:hypothetical protein
MEARNRPLAEWINRIATRQVVLPRFQRKQAWGPGEVADLLQTVLRGLPAGAVLVLDVGDRVPFEWRPMVGAPDHGERVTELLLDGQQRLTALWLSLRDGYEDRKYFVKLDGSAKSLDGAEIESVPRWRKGDKTYPAWADSPAETWNRSLIPLSLAFPDAAGGDKAERWAAEASHGDALVLIRLNKLITNIRTRSATFNIPFLSLPVTTLPEVALDVFVKLNTRTVRLTAFDIVVAQTEESTGESLHELVEGIIARIPALSAYDSSPEDLMLSAAALLQDRVPNQTGYLGLDLKQMVAGWPRIESGVRKAVSFLEEESVFDGQRLPTEAVLAPLIALWTYVPEKPDAEGNARILLRRYLWRSCFTDRYERAAATSALQDYRALRDVLSNSAGPESVPCFDDARHPLPTDEQLLQAGWPKRRDRLARATLALSLRGGALDIADGSPVTRERLSSREYHHLFPVAFLSQQEVGEAEASRALNCALISWRTNRTISAKDPLDYIKERAAASTLGDSEIRRRLMSHAVPYEPLAAGDHQAFLTARAGIAQDGIRALCAGRPWPGGGTA